MELTMLSTIDNPHDPFDEYDAWYNWDETHGYLSLGLLARIAVVSDATSEADQRLAIRHAIDEIVRENVSGMHIKVTKEVEDSLT